MDTAWMIQNNGNAIPVIQHIYANPSESEETLAAAEWLYKNTENTNTKKLVLEVIALWGRKVQGVHRNDFLCAIREEIESKPYRFLSENFIESIIPEIDKVSVEEFDQKVLFEEVNRELNQEFLRARFGGIYHTDLSSKEMVFRISSISFNWYGIICEFVDRAAFQIEAITIVRDEESTGVENGFYRTSLKEMDCYYRLPIAVFRRERESFLRADKNFTIAADHYTGINQQIIDGLSNGKSFRDLRNLSINLRRLEDKLRRFTYKENKLAKEIHYDENNRLSNFQV